jgi:hypothetical protein
MAMFDAVTQDHVRQAIDECDELGSETFLRRYGFGAAREYVLWHDGRSYDSKAILGVGQRYATGTAARSDDFRGGKQGAALVLRDLGFDVIADHKEAELTPDPEGEGWQEASELGSEAAHEAWAGAAREVLIEVAGRYHGLVTYRELAGLVQLRAGIRTKQLVHYWVGDVLVRVSRVCADRGEPLLSSLCVNASGSVGAGYAKAVAKVRGELPGDPDDHAANERLACYRAFGAVIPADGGRPALAPKMAAVRERERSRRASKPQFEATVCPTCNMAIPATGICDNCG